MIESIIDGAPLFSRVVVVGVCVGADPITPAMAINKEIDLRFVLGYTPLEFRDTLQMLAEGKVDPRPLITGTVGLDGVEAAFAALGDPEAPRQDPDRPAQRVDPLLRRSRALAGVRRPRAGSASAPRTERSRPGRLAAASRPAGPRPSSAPARSVRSASR